MVSMGGKQDRFVVSFRLLPCETSAYALSSGLLVVVGVYFLQGMNVCGSEAAKAGRQGNPTRHLAARRALVMMFAKKGEQLNSFA